MSEPPLIERVMSAYRDPLRYIVRHDGVLPGSRRRKDVYVKDAARMRSRLRTATKFTLDDAFTDFATMVSGQFTAQDALNAMWKSKTPYPTMWVEWSEPVRQDALDRAGHGHMYSRDRNGPLQCGVLLRPVDSSENCQVAVVIVPDYSHGPGPYIFEFPIALIWSSEPDVEGVRELRLRARGNELMMTHDGSVELGAQFFLWGIPWLRTVVSDPNNIATFANLADALDEDRVDPNLGQILTATVAMLTPPGMIYMDTLRDQLEPEDWDKYMTGTLAEISGDLRFIVGFLALLNDFEVVTGPTETLSGTRLGTKTKTSKPFMEFRTLGIKLPKQKLFSTVQRRLGQGLPRRAHQVRGHFRTRRNGRRLPVEQWSWVPSHQRGDASLGFIHKDYNVEMGDDL